MIDSENIETIRKKPNKDEIKTGPEKVPPKKFIIRKFSLGSEVTVDRDEIYAERV